MRLLIIIFILLAPAAQATISFNGASGVSGVSTAGTTTTLYGGMAGRDCSTKPAGLVCDNCADSNAFGCAADGNPNRSPLCTCNQRRIYDGLNVSITIKKNTSPNEGHAYAVLTTGGATVTPITNNTANGGTFIDFRWTDLCGLMTTTGGGGGGGNCEAQVDGAYVTLTIYTSNKSVSSDPGNFNFQVTFKILKPSDGDSVYGNSSSLGIGDFKPFPGDERAYIDNIRTPGTFPSINGGSMTVARVFLSKVNMTEATVAKASKTTDLDIIEGGSSLSKQAVDGLENGVLYFMRLAMLDQANNIVQFFPDQAGLPATCTTAPAIECPYAVMPDQVLGMLSKDLNCFVATAAFGSGLETKLDTFREFRQKILLPRTWGKHLVLRYYKYGPYAARLIHEHPVLQVMAQGILWPLYLWSWLALQIGLVSSLVVSALSVITLLTLPWYFLGRRQRA